MRAFFVSWNLQISVRNIKFWEIFWIVHLYKKKVWQFWAFLLPIATWMPLKLLATNFVWWLLCIVVTLAFWLSENAANVFVYLFASSVHCLAWIAFCRVRSGFHKRYSFKFESLIPYIKKSLVCFQNCNVVLHVILWLYNCQTLVFLSVCMRNICVLRRLDSVPVHSICWICLALFVGLFCLHIFFFC